MLQLFGLFPGGGQAALDDLLRVRPPAVQAAGELLKGRGDQEEGDGLRHLLPDLGRALALDLQDHIHALVQFFPDHGHGRAVKIPHVLGVL